MLKYIGGGRHITGIPAQDLSDEDISRLAADFSLQEADFIALMIERGLYEQLKVKRTTTKKIEEENDGIRSESL